MFKLELLELLREYKNADEYQEKKILSSLSKLLKEHKEEAELFIQSSGLNEHEKIILHKASLLDEEQEEEKEVTGEKLKDKTSNDFNIVKSYYKKWLKNSTQNGPESQEGQRIIDEVLSYYAESKPEVLLRIFEITHDKEFENFKTLLKNGLRAHYVSKIKAYKTSSSFETSSWFQKRKIRTTIDRIYEKLGNYEFPIEDIRGVLHE